MAAEAIEIFYSYAQEDEALCKTLEKQLSNLKRQGLITCWHHNKIIAGTAWANETNLHLNTASIILLLISPDFIASDYCYSVEMARAMERHAQGQARVIPIMLRPTDWQDTPLQQLQPLPSDGRPVTGWRKRDEAYLDIVTGIRKAIEQLRSSKAADPNTAALRQEYLNALYDRWKMLDFKGIMHVDMNRPMSIPLTDVFVLPDVLIGVPENETLERADMDDAETDRNVKPVELAEGEVFVSSEYLYSRGFLSPLNDVHSQENRVIIHREELHQALEQHARLVLLGDPGSGKSTFLRYLMLLLTQDIATFSAIFPQLASALPAIPLYIPLASYAEVWQSGNLGERSLKHFLPRFLSENYLDPYLPLLLQELEHGRVFVLLDGLDEIPDASLRMQIVRHVESFTQSFPKNRFIVTSRIVGYKEAPLASEYQAYTLADFSEQQIKTFIQQWCPAYERWVKGVTDPQYLQNLATREAEKIFSAIQRKPEVKKLTVNPLLLTIIALIQRQGIELPGHRVELFDLCAMTLIDTWIKAKGVITATPFSKNNLIKLLCPLAFWMHEHPAVSAIPEAELTEQIVRQILARKITRHEDEAAKLAEQFLDTVRGKTGILIERGKQRYGFLHLTFEEYFAARELELREDRELFIRTHLHEARWREVILLTLSSIGILHNNERGVTSVVQNAILEAHSRFESWLHRDLLFAGSCLVDEIGISLECTDQIIEQIMYLYLTSPYASLRDTIVDTVSQWRGTPLITRVIKITLLLLQKLGKDIAIPVALLSVSTEASLLEEKIDAYSHRLSEQRQLAWTDLLQGIVTTIRSLPSGSDDGIQLVIAAFSDPQTRVRQTAASFLSQLEPEQPVVVDALLDLLADPQEQVKFEAIAGLKQLGQGQSKVLTSLLDLLPYSNTYTKQTVISALKQLGQQEPSVVDTLLQHLSDSNSIVRHSVVSALGHLGQGNSNVINALLNLLFTSDLTLRRNVLIALGEIGQGHPTVIDILLRFLAPPDFEIRQATAQAVGQLGRGQPDSVATLLQLFSNPDWHVRQAVAIALGELSSDHAEVVDALLEHLSDSDLDVKKSVITSLGQSGQGSPKVINALLKSLSAPQTTIRQSVITALGQTGHGHPEIIPALFKHLPAANPNIRSAVISTLGQTGQGSPEVVSAMLQHLADPHWQVRQATATALGQLAADQLVVIDALLTCLSDSDLNVRRAVITALGQSRQKYLEVVTALLPYLLDDDSTINQATITALKQLELASPGLLDALLLSAFALGQEPFPLEISANLSNVQLDFFKSLLPALSNASLAQFLSMTSFSRSLTNYKQEFNNVLVLRTLTFLNVISQEEPLVTTVLLDLLTDESWQVKQIAVQTLGELGQSSAVVIEGLLNLLSDSNKQIRQAAATALGQLGQSSAVVIEGLLALLSDPNWQVRHTAVQALGQIGQGSPKVIESLLKLFSDLDASVKRSAIIILGQLGQGFPNVVEGLLTLLSTSNLLSPPTDVTMTVVGALKQLHFGQQETIDLLLWRLSEPDIDWQLKQAAALALGAIGQNSPEVLDILLKQLSKPYQLETPAAVFALRQLGHESPEIMAALLKLLGSSGVSLRQEAVQALGQLGQGSPEVIDALLKLLLDTSGLIKQAAIQTLGQLGQGSPEVIDALLKQLPDTNSQIRQTTVQALGQLGQGSPEVIDALLRFLFDSNVSTRRAAIAALEQLGRGQPSIADALLKVIISDTLSSVRDAAVEALVALPIDRLSVENQLEKLLQRYDPITSQQLEADPVVDSILSALLKIVG